MELRSPAFADGGAIPIQYACDGPDASPPLMWADEPPGTRALALLVEDPDAPRGSWLHWTIWDLAPEVGTLARGVRPEAGRQGTNDFGRVGWGGPCPPSGTHRYVFRLYALDAPLALAPGADRAAFEAAIDGHVLAEATLMGRYGRR